MIFLGMLKLSELYEKRRLCMTFLLESVRWS
nr:MAG TPA: hypothetical protein [Bacteriophage sp.]